MGQSSDLKCLIFTYRGSTFHEACIEMNLCVNMSNMVKLTSADILIAEVLLHNLIP